jgi:hypothetical protein
MVSFPAPVSHRSARKKKERPGLRGNQPSRSGNYQGLLSPESPTH